MQTASKDLQLLIKRHSLSTEVCMMALVKKYSFTQHLDSYRARCIELLAMIQEPSNVHFIPPTDSCKAQCIVPLAVFQQSSCIKTAARSGHLVE